MTDGETAGQGLDVSSLNGGFGGTVVAPGHERWDDARAAWNRHVDQNPAAVAYVQSPDDVARAIAFARANGLRVAAQGTGHGAGCRAPLHDTLLIRTDRMTGIEIDPKARVGRLEAGVIWADAAAAARDHGLAVLSGSAPDVGIVGYTTGGGFGWLARRYGLACNAVRAMEVVTTDGERRRVDAENDPDLFWALRGGGGSFAVVTAIEYDLVALDEVFAGSVVYPADERSGEIFQAYREWTEGAPDAVTSIARFLHLPPLPMVPEPLQDRPLITLGACYAGTESEAVELLAPLRELGEPVMDLFETMSPAELGHIHMEPEEPVPALVHTSSLREGSADAFDAFVAAAGPGSDSPLLLAELRHAGGAAGSPPAGAGARSHVDGEFVFLGVGMVMGPEAIDPINERLDAIIGALEPWSTGSHYFNFADRPTDLERLFDSETLARLRAVKGRYDPDGVISGSQDIAVA
jgi:FAD/FMN-containing dehydrogenase